MPTEEKRLQCEGNTSCFFFPFVFFLDRITKALVEGTNRDLEGRTEHKRSSFYFSDSFRTIFSNTWLPISQFLSCEISGIA